MSNISSNPLENPYAFNFDYSAMGKKKASSEQNLFAVNNNNQNYAKVEKVAAQQKNSGQGLFAQNLDEATENANKAASASSGPEATEKNGPIVKEEVFQEKFKAKLAENGNDLTGAMEYAKEETFKLIFEEELERNGGNVNMAISFASLEMGMSDKELIGVLEDLAKEYTGSEEIEKALEEAITALDKKISMEDASSKLKDKESNDDKSNSNSNGNNDNLADSLRHIYSQSRENIDYKNNKQNARLYETMIAENASGRNMNANNMNNHNREPLNIMV